MNAVEGQQQRLPRLCCAAGIEEMSGALVGGEMVRGKIRIVQA
jgi:hypothetical protein